MGMFYGHNQAINVFNTILRPYIVEGITYNYTVYINDVEYVVNNEKQLLIEYNIGDVITIDYFDMTVPILKINNIEVELIRMSYTINCAIDFVEIYQEHV